MNTKELESERLILRKFKIEDVSNVYNNWATDYETSKFLSWQPHKDIEVTKKVVQTWINEYENGSYNWIVEIKDNHEPIGSISVVNEKDSVAEIGYCYGSKYWGQGYATEALRTVIEYLLNEEYFYLIEARHIRGNPASGKVMQKAGMKYECYLRDRKFNNVTQKRDDLLVYSIKKEEL